MDCNGNRIELEDAVIQGFIYVPLAFSLSEVSTISTFDLRVFVVLYLGCSDAAVTKDGLGHSGRQPLWRLSLDALHCRKIAEKQDVLLLYILYMQTFRVNKFSVFLKKVIHLFSKAVLNLSKVTIKNLIMS